jgi:anti-anti-sigma regulatory factor
MPTERVKPTPLTAAPIPPPNLDLQEIPMTMSVPAMSAIQVVHNLTKSTSTALVYLRGAIDTKCGPLLRRTLANTVADGVHVIVDLRKVESINVGGLFALHAAAIDIRTLHGGFFVLRHVNGSIRELLEILPLNLPIEETAEWDGVRARQVGHVASAT